MSTNEAELTETIPSWLPHRMLDAIREDAGGCDRGRAATYAGVDHERVRRAIARADGILAAQPRFGDDDAIDVALARAALLVAGAMIRPQTGDADGE